ncbi:MAG: hypothetical protein WBD50_02380, partial [Candidatus Rhabdochlamydia sp.]
FHHTSRPQDQDYLYSEKIISWLASITFYDLKSKIFFLVRNHGNKNSSTDLLKARNLIEKLEAFFGKESRAFKNSYGDLVIESKDGLKQFRMDLNHPTPHIIEFKMKGNKKVQKINKRIYPNDVTLE